MVTVQLVKQVRVFGKTWPKVHREPFWVPWESDLKGSAFLEHAENMRIQSESRVVGCFASNFRYRFH